GTWKIGATTTPATIAEPGGGNSGSATADYVFTSPGVYSVLLMLTNSCGGVDTASVSMMAAAQDPFPQNGVLDDFNRADCSIGGSWIDQASAFTIDANRLAGAIGEHYVEWNRATFGPNQEVFLTLSVIGASTIEHNVMLKTQGTSWNTGHLEVSYETATGSVGVYAFTPPVTWTTNGTISGVTFAPGDQLGARALSDGTVKVYRNGALLGSFVTTAYARVGGRIGPASSSAVLSRFADFGGGDVLPSPLLGAAPIAVPRTASLSEAFPNPTSGGVEWSLALPEA